MQSGCGRTGPVWAIEHYGVQPDLLVSGKTLGGGLPLAAVTGRAEVMDAVPPGGLGGTFGGNPLSCAPRRTSVLDVAPRNRAPRRSDRRAPARAADRDGARRLGEVRGLGPMLAIELPEQSPDARRASAAAREQGLLLLSCGLYGNVIRILVPFAIADDELERGLDILEGALGRGTADVDVVGGSQDLRRRGRRRRRRPGGRRRRVLHAARPVGLREDDDAADDRRLRAPRRRHDQLGGEDITDRPPYARDVNTVFQDYALFPHMTVAENVGYGLQGEGREARRAGARVGEVLERVRLDGYGDRKPVQLSGGQRQRVALARSIVNRPKVLLLDEPLGALDLKLRQEMQVFLKALQRDLGMTFIYVTHDQEEALTMSDHVAVFNEGRIEQVGRPAEVYEHPATEFVAGFVGTSNILERDGRRCSVRPERITRRTSAATEQATVDDVVFVGAFTRYLVATDAGERLTVVQQNDGSTLAPGGGQVAWRDEDAFRAQHGNSDEQEVR